MRFVSDLLWKEVNSSAGCRTRTNSSDVILGILVGGGTPMLHANFQKG